MCNDWKIERYNKDLRQLWNDMVAASRNAVFLADRGYMEYHSDRFEDYSMIAFKDGRPMALLPANLTADGTLHSHQGLTYGGWILPKRHLDAVDFMDMWRSWLCYMSDCGIVNVDYKPLPTIYHLYPSQEDHYALFRSGARLTEVNLSEALQPLCNPGFNTLQRRHLRKAASEITVGEALGEKEIGVFHMVLCECLRERHGAMPVHTLDELLRLRDAFPENIRVFIARAGDCVVGGVCIYDTGTVAHVQYIATTSAGRRLNALTPLFARLMTEEFSKRRYFDFGTSNENGGQVLNPGLVRQKGSYGATGVAYERYGFSVSEALSIF